MLLVAPLSVLLYNVVNTIGAPGLFNTWLMLP